MGNNPKVKSVYLNKKKKHDLRASKVILHLESKLAGVCGSRF